jgi:multiple sugar transport system permease protein
VLIFLLTPIAFALYLSVHDWEIVVPHKPFIGGGNFAEMFHDPLFWNALKNTLIYSLNVPAGMALALGVALMLNRDLRGVHLLRTLYFLPSVSSFVAIALVWRLLYEPQIGMANFILDWLGLPKSLWLNSPNTAMLALMIMSVWLGLGYQMVIFLAGLQGIPSALYEAAMIDGASPWQRFRTITLPLLQPTTFFIFITSWIGSFQVFTAIYVMTGGGPARSTDVVVHHIYQAAWNNLRMGYASAMSMVLFVIIMISTWLQFRLMGREVEYV